MNDYGRDRCAGMARSSQTNAESLEALRVMKSCSESEEQGDKEDNAHNRPLVTHGSEIEDQLQSYVGSTWQDGSITFKLLCVSTHTLRVKVGRGKRRQRQRDVIGSYANTSLYETLDEVPFNALQWSTAKEVLGWLKETEIGI